MHHRQDAGATSLMAVTLEAIESPPVAYISSYAVSASSNDLRKTLNEVLLERTRSEYGRKTTIFEEARARIAALGEIPKNWDSYGAQAPNATSIHNAQRVLNLVASSNLIPTQILPSAEGGVGICFLRNDIYADIECSNGGEVLGVYYKGKEMPHLLETDTTDPSIKRALQQISTVIIG